ncbi:MAG: GPW/gp25 family protein [Candidatus Zixiibacteriota bacterium]
MEYLALPLVLYDGFLGRTDLRESITHSVGLLISTRIGQMRFMPNYGCDLWEKEHSDLYTASRADIRASLRNAIGQFEKRLYNVSVSVLSEVKAAAGSGSTRGVAVRVTGYFTEEDEEQKFEATFNIG